MPPLKALPVAKISGLVVDDAGKAVPNALIQATAFLSDERSKTIQTATNGAGWFDVAFVEPGKYLIYASIPGKYSQTLELVEVLPPQGTFPRSRIKMTLRPLSRIPNCGGPVEVLKTDELRSEFAKEVKTEFLHAWNGYKKYAWGNDDLKPLSKSYHNWYSEPLLMTPVDTLDTLVLMGLDEEAKKTADYIAKNLSFDKDISVQKFEITIRLLGGLLSGYQMTGDKRLLELADDLGKRLLPAFESKTGIPYRYINLRTGEVRGNETNPAEAGTLIIEFGTLSKLTGKPVYFEKAKRALKGLFERRSRIGLIGTRIDVETGEWTNKDSHVSAEIDSYYEYLLKCWKLFGDRECKEMWDKSIPAVNKYLADDTKTGLWYGHADMETGKRTATTYGALDAFFPAVLALSGDLERAKRLQASSFLMWNKHGIEPEVYDYVADEVKHPGYPLRPEIIESAYYLYRYTKDPRYLEMGKKIFEDFRTHCRTEAGYASLRNVITKEKSDTMQSFVLAETFKYFYLLFAPEETLDFEKVVFNTEAHPVRATWKKD